MLTIIFVCECKCSFIYEIYVQLCVIDFIVCFNNLCLNCLQKEYCHRLLGIEPTAVGLSIQILCRVSRSAKYTTRAYCPVWWVLWWKSVLCTKERTKIGQGLPISEKWKKTVLIISKVSLLAAHYLFFYSQSYTYWVHF